MKIMLIEDDNRKRNKIIQYLNSEGIDTSSIVLAKSLTDFAAKVGVEDIGLFIIDLMIPSQDDGKVQNNGRAILEILIKADKADALMLAISSYPDDFKDLKDFYESCGCILTSFKGDVWKSTLKYLLTQLKKNTRFDFVIFCALSDERRPYASLLQGKTVRRGAIDCLDVEINEKKGTVILLPRMGLVNAGIVAGLCIDRFKPKIVGMSGICGGFSGSAEFGQLLICESVYEYQSGKWSEDGFKQEPYQVETDNTLITILRGLIEDRSFLQTLERGFCGDNRPQKMNPPKISIFTSGSAVIADAKYLEQIEVIHRKVSGLDMEVFAIQRAAQLAHHKPLSISAKVVVDLCNSQKNDDLHEYGCYISAKFLIEAIKHSDFKE